jgi:nucleotidyltransferase/DNA polymerase involved in DNA repair
MKSESRRLGDLISVGPAMLRDFELLGVRSVAQLARRSPQRLYRELGRVARQHQDICVLDTFQAAVAQARDPRLPAEQCEWWWWSSQRKAEESRGGNDNAEMPRSPRLRREERFSRPYGRRKA